MYLTFKHNLYIIIMRLLKELHPANALIKDLSEICDVFHV